MTSARQPDLFTTGPGAPVDVAPRAAETADLSAGVPSAIRLGTSSWAFPGWAGIVYDRSAPRSVLASHGLAAYARHPLLRCVGVDRGYYAPVPERTLARLADQTSGDFRFVLKADRRLVFPGGEGSDRDLLLNPTWAAQEVEGPASHALGGRLGAVLYQFPPLSATAFGGPRRFAEALYRFLSRLTPGVPRAVEIRTPGFLTSDYAAALHHGNARHAYVVHPEMPELAVQSRQVPPSGPGPAVIRWMLKPGHTYAAARDAWSPFRRLASPDPKRRLQVAELARAAAEAGASVHVVVNNKAEGSSPLSVEEIARALSVGPDATF